MGQNLNRNKTLNKFCLSLDFLESEEGDKTEPNVLSPHASRIKTPERCYCTQHAGWGICTTLQQLPQPTQVIKFAGTSSLFVLGAAGDQGFPPSLYNPLFPSDPCSAHWLGMAGSLLACTPGSSGFPGGLSHAMQGGNGVEMGLLSKEKRQAGS